MDNILDALWDKDLSFSVHGKIYFIGIVVTVWEFYFMHKNHFCGSFYNVFVTFALPKH